MVFSSLSFLLLFLPVTLILYYILPGRARDFVLFLASLLFYAWGEPLNVLLMLFSILFNYCCGLLMEKEPRYKKYLLVFALVINLGMLLFYKYTGFLLENLGSLLGVDIRFIDPALPVGISFYTFQALSYVIDLYRGKYPAQRDFLRFGCYITMFPQLIAGPIVRYEDIRSDLECRVLSLDRVGRGAERLIFGLAKKVLLANPAGALLENLKALPEQTVLSGWLVALCCCFQIYFDFSGYSDMAIGLGEMMGFRFLENFNYSYLADSVTDFWRRQHISLSVWFREYVYIPLGGNRCSKGRHILNIFIVWLLTGFWHGAAWNYLLWGMYFAVLLVLDKYCFSRLKLPRFVRRIITLALIAVSMVIFAVEDFPLLGRLLRAMFGMGAGVYDGASLYYLSGSWILLLIEAFFCLPLFKRCFDRLAEKALPGKLLAGLIGLAIFALALVFLVSQSFNPFLYYRF